MPYTFTRTARLATTAVVAVILLAACSSPSGPELSAPDALKSASSGSLTLIDIRTPKEWRQTGVPQGAERIEMRQSGGSKAFVAAVEQALGGNKDAPLALICRTGNRSGVMQGVLKKAGFTEVYNVREGMAGSGAGPGWVRRGLPILPCPTC